MKIGILSRSAKCYSTQRLHEAAQDRGHKVKVLNTLKFSIHVRESEPGLDYGDKPLGRYDAVIPRIGASVTFFGTAVVRQFEQMGVFTLNSSHSISVSRDKLRSMQALSRHDIGIPASAFVRRREDILPAIKMVGGVPVIIKLLEGTQGVGVILAESIKVAEAIVETMQGAKQNVMLQKFVAESKGKDVRAFVVGDRVVAAMRRRARGTEFRSNVHRGGTTEAVTLEPAYEQTAVRAAQILGLRVAGVDMLESKDGPQVMEVNSSPGLEGIEGITKIDIASLIIQHVEEQAQFPEIDINQKLTVKGGYGVSEITIDAQHPLANRALAEAGLHDRDVLVLSINRQGVVIPNPKGMQTILPGDVLLCFGKKITLRGLGPSAARGEKKRGKAPAPGVAPGTPGIPETPGKAPEIRVEAVAPAREVVTV